MVQQLAALATAFQLEETKGSLSMAASIETTGSGTQTAKGVRLNEDERVYLLPHFLMLLVGKPGSGKTTLVCELMTNPKFYREKFDDIYLISPSFQKMPISEMIGKDHAISHLSVDWIYE